MDDSIFNNVDVSYVPPFFLSETIDLKILFRMILGFIFFVLIIVFTQMFVAILQHIFRDILGWEYKIDKKVVSTILHYYSELNNITLLKLPNTPDIIRDSIITNDNKKRSKEENLTPDNSDYGEDYNNDQNDNGYNSTDSYRINEKITSCRNEDDIRDSENYASRGSYNRYRESNNLKPKNSYTNNIQSVYKENIIQDEPKYCNSNNAIDDVLHVDKNFLKYYKSTGGYMRTNGFLLFYFFIGLFMLMVGLIGGFFIAGLNVWLILSAAGLYTYVGLFHLADFTRCIVYYLYIISTSYLKIGDIIRIGDKEGIIVKINILHTTIMSEDLRKKNLKKLKLKDPLEENVLISYLRESDWFTRIPNSELFGPIDIKHLYDDTL